MQSPLLILQASLQSWLLDPDPDGRQKLWDIVSEFPRAAIDVQDSEVRALWGFVLAAAELALLTPPSREGEVMDLARAAHAFTLKHPANRHDQSAAIAAARQHYGGEVPYWLRNGAELSGKREGAA